MDDIFLYILVIIIIIIIIIVIYNYSKNIEKFSFEDISLLYCHVFKKDDELIGDFPESCNTSPNNTFKNNITIPPNKGDDGDEGQKLTNKVININNEYKCNNCTPVVNRIKTSIKNINIDENLNIEPGIIIPNYVTLTTNKIIFEDITHIRESIDNSKLNKLKDLTKSYLKCSEDMYNTEANNIVKGSIGECIDCPVCPTGQYSTCGGSRNSIGECNVCSVCPVGQYLKDCEGRNKGICTQNKCNCNNGTASQGTDCLVNGNNHCQFCFDHYELKDETCSECESRKPENSTYTLNTCGWNCNSGYQKNSNVCLKQCLAGEKRNETSNTCEPCEADYYKKTVQGETHTDTTCSQCPIGSTTNGNEGNTDCTARPGYEYILDENTYKPIDGNIDNDANGYIDSCAYNFGFNSQDTENRECTICPTIDYGGYDENETPNNCSNKICNPGYKLINMTCQPCGEDYYKGETNDNTECTECPIGSTTNSNETATVITDCTARPGYVRISNNNYTPISGNIDNKNLDGSEGADGRIDSCAYNFGFNSDSTENRECTICPTIDYGGYDQNLTPNNCSNKICNSGYELINMTCQPCGRDRYKEDTNNNECTQCSIGSTTNSNETATSITDCTARPGYEYIESTYKPKDGNIDNNANGYITGCRSGYYYDGTECIVCTSFDGIVCNGSDTLENSNRTLQPNYSWDRNTATKCLQGEKRDGTVTIGDSNITCDLCDYKPDYSQYDDNEGNQLYNRDDSCKWECNEDYYHDEKACPDNSEYITNEEGGYCICDLGFELNNNSCQKI